MSGRSYLSIGDVLSLLREEFPDVTISKIRFLESQGLVDPERSPSGYRKFYDQDVARLRWVLRKQRDHFLPLRVIRDRLAAAGNGVPPDDDPADAEWRREETAAVPVGAHAASQEAEEGADDGASRGNGASSRPARAGNDTTAAAGSPQAEFVQGRGDEPVGPTTNGAEARRTQRAEARAGSRAEARIDPPSRAELHEGQPMDDPVTPEPGAGGSATPATHARQPAAQVRETAVAASAPPETSALQPPGPSALHASVSGVSLTLAELCAASGLTPQAVASLEACGLLSPMSIAGGQFYDEEALTVAKLVVAFERFGIEPRHLRLFRNAADREVGLIEQVVAPLLRQRNPEARQRAIESARELAGLGQSLRAALVRSELHRQLGT